jgi:hypothetical protein
MESIVLIGAEDVSRAGHNMQSAAEQMSRAVGNLSEVLERHQRFMDDWLDRFAQTVDAMRGGD